MLGAEHTRSPRRPRAFAGQNLRPVPGASNGPEGSSRCASFLLGDEGRRAGRPKGWGSERNPGVDPASDRRLTSAVSGNVGAGHVHHFDLRVAQSGAMAEHVESERSPTRRGAVAVDHPPGLGLGGAMAKSPDRALVGATDGRPSIAKIAFTSEDRVREVIHNFNADGFGSLVVSTREDGRRSSPSRTPGDQEDRPLPSGGPRPAFLDLEPVEAGRVPRRRGGGRRHLSRGSAGSPS